MGYKIVYFLVTTIGICQCACLHVEGILSGNRLGSVPLGVSLGDGVLDVEGICARAGPTCLNCTNAVSCIQLPSGWLRVDLQTCGEGTTCNARLGGCSTRAVPECQPEAQQFHHICEQVGIFPDAHDCRKFHLCSPPSDYPHERPADHATVFCPRHYAYDPLTAQCRIKLQYGQCDRKPVPECRKIGQSGPLSDSPNHYYVCLSKSGTLYPQIFVCPHGYYFYNNFCNSEPLANPTSDLKTEITSSTTETVATSTEKKELLKNHETSTVYTTTDYPADTFLADKFDLSEYKTPSESNLPTFNSYEYLSAESY